MRIATWNLEGKWTPSHQNFLAGLRADVLLLTEVPDIVELPGLRIHFTAGEMQPGRRWAAVCSRDRLHPLPEPHPATALADVGGLRMASSILPWRTCGGEHPWLGADQATRTAHAIDAIEAADPVIWGGDWNHELTGRLYVGCKPGRERILLALDQLGLDAPTSESKHRLQGARTIDHVAVPSFWKISTVEHHSAIVNGVELSDHDAYVVEVT